MSIIYECRHCRRVLGELDQRTVGISDLGIDQLSQEEKNQMIKYHDDGDLSVYIICESCEASLEDNPHYHELEFFIQ